MYRAQLLAGREEDPLTVEIDAYADGTKPPVSSSSFFIINGVGQCAGDYVSLECEWITRRSVVGKAPGPTVTETETRGQPGFGWLHATVAIAGAVSQEQAGSTTPLQEVSPGPWSTPIGCCNERSRSSSHHGLVEPPSRRVRPRLVQSVITVEAGMPLRSFIHESP